MKHKYTYKEAYAFAKALMPKQKPFIWHGIARDLLLHVNIVLSEPNERTAKLRRELRDARARQGELRKKLAIARGMLYSARGVIGRTLPRGDCTPEEIDDVLKQTADDGKEWS